MTREELLKIAKPVLFNTEMVIAILEGRKTVTRRVIKPKSKNACGISINTRRSDSVVVGVYEYDEGGRDFDNALKPPYAAGDYLYVRETWCKGAIDCGETPSGQDEFFVSQCEGEDDYILKAHALHENIGIEDVAWKPSIHMPKEAARIFLKVTDVRVERLQDITEEQAKAEGTKETFPPLAVDEFRDIWNSTIKKQDLDTYGWDSSPWVWVIEFEKVEV